MTRWATFTNGIFNGMDWTNVFCAGGAVLANLTADNSGYKTSDIDLFLYGLDSDEAANAKLRELHALVVRNTGGRGDVIRTARAVTILNAAPFRHVQVVLRVYKSPAEVLLGFDIDSCTVGFDGTNVYCMERFKRALTKRYNLVNKSRRSLTYEQRLYKYSRRGFAVAVPNLDKSRVNPDIFKRRLPELFGLSKLLKYDNLAQDNIRTARSGPNGANFPVYRINGEEKSDYNGDLAIPWSEGLKIQNIMHILKIRDRAHFFGQVQRNKKADKNPSLNVEKKKPEHLFETIFFDTTGTDGSAQPKIAWIRNNPAYQDIDGGFTRPLMTGSFQLPPPVQAVWDQESYASFETNFNGLSQDQGYVPGENAGSQKPSGEFGSPSFGVKKAAASDEPTAPANKDTRGGFVQYQGSGTTDASPINLAAFGGPTAAASSFSFGSDTSSFAPTSSFSAISAPVAAGTAPQKREGASFAPTKFSVAAKPPKAVPTTKTTATSSIAATSSIPTFPQMPSSSAAFAAPSSSSGGAVSGASMSLLLQEFASLRQFITETLKNPSSLQHAGGQEEATPTTKLLILVSLCFKQGSISSEEKNTLKDLIIDRHEAVFAALEVFEIDQDLGELVDTFKRVIQSKNAH